MFCKFLGGCINKTFPYLQMFKCSYSTQVTGYSSNEAFGSGIGIGVTTFVGKLQIISRKYIAKKWMIYGVQLWLF